MKQAIPESVLQQHIAFLGKTGSGKTSTAKLAIEQIVRDNPAARVCVLDPIKSDWWGLTSSADGKRPGLPFHILGGPRGHVPLHDSAGKAIGELVATGALPLSIIDMADFNAGGLQKFFNDFAPALLKRIRGVVYLVIEEAHEFAPKERSGIGAESMAIHFAKKLATAGRSKGVRMMVLTQRTQALHNALLGSCDTMIAHRLTAPADQEPVKKWLKANVNKEIFEKVSSSMSSLKTGSAWICSGEAQVAELVQFPKITTYDNSATPTGDSGDHEVKTAPVDADKLRSIIGEAVKQAEADDPPKLRVQIADRDRKIAVLERQLGAAAGAGPEAIAAARSEGYAGGLEAGFGRGFDEAGRQATIAFNAFREQARATVLNFANSFDDNAKSEKIGLVFPESGSPTSQGLRLPPAKLTAPAREAVRAAPRKPMPAASGNGALTNPQLTLLSSLAWWRAMGHDNPSRPQVAAIAGWRVTAGHLKNVIGSLNSAGLTVSRDGRVALTDAGDEVAPEPDMSVTLHDGLRGVLSKPQRQIFECLLSSGRRSLSRAEIAESVGWDANAGHLKNVIGSMRTLEIIGYPSSGMVELQPWVLG
jgi:uncharacterized protein